jgi:hypothetical protein
MTTKFFLAIGSYLTFAGQLNLVVGHEVMQ